MKHPILSGNDIRKQFIDFFVERGHTAVRSSSLVPVGDQTILFTNAGMVQFKDVFLGTDKREYKRAADSQKCMRVAGKHNDLDEVGRDDTHHTFFEMLGNWSFGDYYKKEAIEWAWTLLTEVWGLDRSKLWATCFKDERGEIEADAEAFEIWKRQPGMNPDHVRYFGRKENFWEMADTGPCGPCSEIHIDLGPDHCDKRDIPGHVCSVNGDCSRFLELWNLVFIQYNRVGPNELLPLTQKFVDTGMGFERIVSILQGVDSNYRTDLFRAALETIQRLTGTDDAEMAANFTPYRVICDHARAASFLIADGVVPGNIGRNYICRMIIRRAVRFGHQLGLTEPFMHKVAEAMIETYQDAYPELRRSHDAILSGLIAEEERFNKTLDAGIHQLNEILAGMRAEGKTVIDGAVCFDLYSTHGLPIEITYDLVRDQGFDVDREGYRAAAEAHRIASGAGKAIGRMTGEEAERYGVYLNELISGGKLPAEGVRYDPYQREPMETTLLLALSDGAPYAAIGEGEDAELIVGATNLYLEMGGQVSDTGTIRAADGSFVFEVKDVRRPLNGLILHSGTVVSGTVEAGKAAVVEIDLERRRDIQANHTATHLLHAALHRVIGDQARQAGSLVAPDRLRFDFNSNRALTAEELSEIERIVNQDILAGYPVTTTIENLDDAINEGVMAIFNEKYGDRVRVLRVLDGGTPVSAELCGGTHVSNTAEIGPFILLSEGSVATGIRRIEAITRRAAIEFIRVQNLLVHEMTRVFNVSREDLLKHAVETRQNLKELAKELDAVKRSALIQKLGDLKERSEEIHGVPTLMMLVPGMEMDALRQLSDRFKSEHENAVTVLGTVIDGQVQFIASVSDALAKRGLSASELIRRMTALVGGKGGGRPTMAQGGGKDVSKADAAMAAAREMIRERAEG